MEKDSKLILQCTKILAVVGVLFTAMEAFSGNFITALLIALLVGGLIAPIFLLHQRWSLEVATHVLCLGAFGVVLLIECLKGEVDMMFPLYIACVAMGAMFFSLPLLKRQVAVTNVGLLVVFVFFNNQVCVDGSVSYLLRAMLGMNACFLLIYIAIKWGCGFMETAQRQQQENEDLLEQVQHRLAENQQAAAQQQELLHQVHQAAQDIFSGSGQVSSSAQSFSRSSADQAASVQLLVNQVENISGQVDETAENAASACRQVELAGQTVESCNQKMQEMATAMELITSKSNEISKIIKTIEDIAFQTNILALNAAVEAARAGTAGKGFAVVADEVRNLANKSSDASKSTAALIADSIAAIEQGMEIAQVAAGALSQVTEQQQMVSSTVETISLATQQQTQALSQITQEIGQISQVVQQNSDTATQSTTASQSLFDQAQSLQDLVSRFEEEEEAPAQE